MDTSLTALNVTNSLAQRYEDVKNNIRRLEGANSRTEITLNNFIRMREWYENSQDSVSDRGRENILGYFETCNINMEAAKRCLSEIENIFRPVHLDGRLDWLKRGLAFVIHYRKGK